MSQPEDSDAKGNEPSATGPYPEHSARGDTPVFTPFRLGRYRVEKQLGSGGFGQVFLAWDDELQRRVAIKVASRVVGPETAEAYLREARMVASLDHPHIVPVYDAGWSDDGKCFVVSKLVEGCNLEQRSRLGRLGHRESAELIATIAEALQAAHERDVVHRDVKPSNILIDTQGRPYLCDFGMALRETDFGTGPRNAGSPLWMSPEQARSEGHLVDGRSDVFALGAVLYWLLTGRPPFSGADVSEVLRRIANEDARPLRQRDGSIPIELERVCLKAMARITSDRYRSAQDFASDLRNHLGTPARVHVERRFTALESENKLLRIEQEWQAESNRFRGSLGVPRLHHGCLGMIGGGWIAGIGAVVAYSAYKLGEPMGATFGVAIAMIAMGLGFPLYLFYRYGKYQQAYRRYQQRRTGAVSNSWPQ